MIIYRYLLINYVCTYNNQKCELKIFKITIYPTFSHFLKFIP
jgi:hypothetical protein